MEKKSNTTKDSKTTVKKSVKKTNTSKTKSTNKTTQNKSNMNIKPNLKNNIKLGNITVDKKKISIFIGIIVLLIVLLVIFLNKGVKINEETDISKLDAKKNSEQISQKYNEEGMKAQFLVDYDAVQTASAMYMLNNMSSESSSLDSILSTLKDDLKKEKFEVLDTQRPNIWNGDWSINQEGTIKFKFKTKSIEPIWINDQDLVNKIILN